MLTLRSSMGVVLRWVMFGVVVSSPSFALAQVPPAKPPAIEEENPRTLAGHLFAPSDLVRHPFTATYAHIGIGYGYARARGPIYDVQGRSSGTRDYDVAELQQRLEVQVKVLPWWAVRAGTTVQLDSGSSSDALTAIGALASWTASVGSTATFKLGQRLQLGGTLDVYGGRSYDLNVAGSLANAAKAKQLDFADLISPSTTASIVPGVVAAMAINRAVGVGAQAQYARGVMSLNGAPGGTDDLVFGTVVDLDLRTITIVPIAAVAAYKLKLPLQGNENHPVNAVDLSVFYVHQHNLVVGPELDVSWFTLVLVPSGVLPKVAPLTREAGANAYRAQILMRYYW